MSTKPRYPNIEVKLIGADGNAFAVLGTVRKEMRRAGVSELEVQKFMTEATSGNYDQLLATVIRWVEVK